MAAFIFRFLITSLLFSCSNAAPDSGYYFPAEWEEQESVWLGWSTDSSIQNVHLQMAKALDGKVGLTILSRSAALQASAMLSLYQAGIDTVVIQKRIHYIPNIFIRDAGPRFLKNQKDGLAIADFAWTNYGYPASFGNYQFSNQRGEIDNDLAKESNWKVVGSDIVMEGGAIDLSSDMLICFKETALQRNPARSLGDIERDLLKVYGKSKMIWLNRMPLMDKVVEGPKAGNYFGYGANGHTDEFVRFVNDTTIMVGLIDSSEKDDDPVSRADFGIMNENLKILRQATGVNGKPFRIIELPVPSYSVYAVKEILTAEQIREGDGRVLFSKNRPGDQIRWLPAVSYLNFFISNKTVLIAKYWEPGLPESVRRKDEQVLGIMQKAFPGRDIVQINPLALNRNGGGMHCATQQQPVR